ncbi:MAG: hypothetical protein MJZ50_09680 [Treponema sp.]|nr:hypothetical protein [Treponema sp.]
MEFILNLLLLIVGFILLVKGADWFVDSAAGIASKLGVPELVIGLPLVAFGTSAPELSVSLTSALKLNSVGITIGNVVRSNIMNIVLILGIRISKKDFISHYPASEDIKFIHSKSYRNSEIAELLLKKLK